MAKAEKKPVEGKKIGNLEIDNTFTPVTYDPQYILMVNKLKKYMEKAIDAQMEGKGFSLVEVVSACPTNWGMTPQQALNWVESDMLPYYPLGVYKDRSAEKEGK